MCCGIKDYYICLSITARKICAQVYKNVVFSMVKVITELEVVGIVHSPKSVEDYVVKPVGQRDRVVMVFVHGAFFSACDTVKRRCRLYFLLPSVVSPNTSHTQQVSLHRTVQASTCLLVCDTFKIIWRFSEGTKVRSKHFFRICLILIYVTSFLCFGLQAKLIKFKINMK